MRLMAAFAWAVMFIWPGVVPCYAEKHFALVIGNDRYANLPADQQPRKVVNDTGAVGYALGSPGLEVISGENHGRPAVVDKFDRLINSLHPATLRHFSPPVVEWRSARRTTSYPRDVLTAGQDMRLAHASLVGGGGLAKALEVLLITMGVAGGVAVGAAGLVAGVWLLRRSGADEHPDDSEAEARRISFFAALKQSVPVQEPLRKALVNLEAAVCLVKSTAAAPQDVDVTVFAPPVVPLREEVIVQVIFHTPEREAEALARAQKVEPAAQALASVPLTIQVRQNDNIKVSMECADAAISEPVQNTVWNGRLVYLYFTIRMPNGETVVRPKLRVFVNGIPAGNLIFKISVKQNAPDLPPAPANEIVRTFRKPFLSYASEDRVQVLKAAQLLDALKMDYFQDLLNLSPGDRWERRLYAEIDSSDLFLLFWSGHAQQSEWVIREAEYALQRAKVAPGDRPLEIVPVLLEGPPPPLPPASLRDIHFNDPIRHIIFAEESVTDAARHRAAQGSGLTAESRPE